MKKRRVYLGISKLSKNETVQIYQVPNSLKAYYRMRRQAMRDIRRYEIIVRCHQGLSGSPYPYSIMHREDLARALASGSFTQLSKTLS